MLHNITEKIITDIEQYSQQHSLHHRFVGGVSFGGLLNEKTKTTILFDTKTILLSKHNKNVTLRSDKTVRDLDMILFCSDKKKITMFKKFIAGLRTKYAGFPYFPDISFEPTLYPSLGIRNTFAQFVTTLEVDKNNQLFLTFEGIRQPISWQSVEPWQVRLEQGLQFTVRNPIADYYAYLFRSPAGPKPKDMKKILLLKQLADTVIIAGKQQDISIDYLSLEYYGAWEQYIEKLKKSTDPVIAAKKFWTNLYWQTIGTTFAHNFSRYGNNFTGIKE